MLACLQLTYKGEDIGDKRGHYYTCDIPGYSMELVLTERPRDATIVAMLTDGRLQRCV